MDSKDFKPMIDLFIVVGEPSGDLHGAKLIRDLLSLHPQLKIGAVAGPRMRAEKIEPFFPMENLQVMGFIDVLLSLPKIARQFFAIRKKILQLNPKAVVCIDYPGFNLRLARSLRKKGYRGKIIHYICPTVWAWGKKRIPLMAKNLDLLLTLFPFEPACFAGTKLPAKYVGHPLLSAIAPPQPLKGQRRIVGIFPGSRKKEIERNLSIQIAVAKRLREIDPSLEIVISIAQAGLEPQIRELSGEIPLSPPQKNYELMRSCWVALATSGTVNLELALHEVPTVVNFAISSLDCFLAQKIFKINLPFYCIVNIIASKRIFPELFGPHFTEERLFEEARELTLNQKSRETCLKGCLEVRNLLSANNQTANAAAELLSVIDF